MYNASDMISREEAAKRLETQAEKWKGSFSGEAFEFAAKIVRGVPAAQRWIPVTDERKPKQLQECLCCCAFEYDLNWRWYCVLKWHDIPYQDNGIVNRPHFTDEGVHGMVVTHWMPLPELPKGE